MLDYGIIGNCNTCALIDRKGSIKWMCFPEFDMPSVFAKILDEKKGGSFEIRHKGKFKVTQKYLEDTNILMTYFRSDKEEFKVTDFFPRYKKLLPKKKTVVLKQNRLIRIIEPIKGTPQIRIVFDPKLDYARAETKLVDTETHIDVKNGRVDLQLVTNADHGKILEQETISLRHRLFFAVGYTDNPAELNLKRCLTLMNATKNYWRRWVGSLVLPKKYRDVIIRSALTLKLLTFGRTGAIIAAPTTSIPEEIGSGRCWDYRYCWVRDASFCVDALKKIGRKSEAKKLINFIMNRSLEDDYTQIMYGVRGETRIKEFTLEHLDGFKGSKPVRIGNAAYKQNQLDIYGELLDIFYLYFAFYRYENKMTSKQWRFLRYLVNQIKFNWEKKDSGIWEFRDLPNHYTISKMMCCIGVDRAIKIAQHFNKDTYLQEWIELRDEIKNDVLKNGYNKDAKAFTIYYGSRDLDSSLLLMAHYRFLEPDDPRLINTVKAIYKNLMDDYLVQRYRIKDDFGKSTSAFTICSFWMIQALLYIGEKKKAERMYEKLMKRANHLGLFSEDIDLKTRKQLGNFPQAYTHISIINTSILLSEWGEDIEKIDWKDIKLKNVL